MGRIKKKKKNVYNDATYYLCFDSTALIIVLRDMINVVRFRVPIQSVDDVTVQFLKIIFVTRKLYYEVKTAKLAELRQKHSRVPFY